MIENNENVNKNAFGDVIPEDTSQANSVADIEKGTDTVQVKVDNVADQELKGDPADVNTSVVNSETDGVNESTESLPGESEQTVDDITKNPRPMDGKVPTEAQDSSSLDSVDQEDIAATRNFKAIRESKRRLESELAEQAKKIQEYELEIKKHESSGELEIDTDLVNNDAQLQKMQQMYAQTQAMQVEIQLKSKYTDFDKVVSADNVDVLKSLYPKEAYNIINEKDIYKKAEKAYEAMKKYNIFTTDDNTTTNFEAKKERVARNSAKPRPISSARPGSPALGAANAFAEDSDDARRRTFAEMQRLAKGE